MADKLKLGVQKRFQKAPAKIAPSKQDRQIKRLMEKYGVREKEIEKAPQDTDDNFPSD